jgi:photosystem II stability/assembly factor-like uncharacterized protein
MKASAIIFYIFCFLGIYFLNSCKSNPINDGGNAQIGEWQSLGLENESITSIAIDPNDENIIYAGSSSDFSSGTSGKLFKSTDSGESWNLLISTSDARFNEIIIDPLNTNILYVANGSILKSIDAGLNFSDITGNIQTNYETKAYVLTIDQKNPNILFAGTGGFFGGGLYKSIDAGNNWSWIGDSLKGGVTSIAIDPNNLNTLYVGTAGETILWKSTDGGKLWTQTGLGGKGLIHDIRIESVASGNIFVATRTGVWKRSDNGINWQIFNEGLPDNCSVIKVLEDTGTKAFYVAETNNNGNGIYKRDVGGIWEKFDTGQIDTLSSFYYSDLKITKKNKFLYFGNKGLSRYQL